ncbi:hypothetical protein IFM89_010448 [Coptis chinensis]|uniref:Uncharacterized protein n=1 Tax=Coptis chinensis TaxID=261450 RepID=A0A835LZB6_9MAGN|nr:hypothetical protein IFM89_010448 [Coptis chinensis]
MGNSFGCSASRERLVSVARDGDLVEAKMLLEFNPCLAKYSTFGGLNSPLHFAAARGHTEIVALLLENGADVNSRNYCGQTVLMHVCRHVHWEVVQAFLLFKSNVTRADYLGRTALHFAAVNGHTNNGDRGNGSVLKNKFGQCALSKFVNKAADGGITTLHMAALNGYFNCVQLLLDIHANVSAVTFHYGTSTDLTAQGANTRMEGHTTTSGAIVNIFTGQPSGAAQGVTTPDIQVENQNHVRGVEQSIAQIMVQQLNTNYSVVATSSLVVNNAIVVIPEAREFVIDSNVRHKPVATGEAGVNMEMRLNLRRSLHAPIRKQGIKSRQVFACVVLKVRADSYKKDPDSKIRIPL